MNALRHRVSGTAFSRLAASGGGAEAVAELCAAQASKHRLLVRYLVDVSRRTGHHDAELVSRAYDALSELEDRSPVEVDRCLRYPAVGAWALRACRSVAAGSGEPGRLATVALAASVRAGTSCRLPIPVSDGELVLPSLGRVRLPSGTPRVVEAAVEPVDGGAELHLDGRAFRVTPQRDHHGWQALHHPLDDPELTIDDLDPYRWPGDDVDGRLTDERRHQWTACLHEAWELLATRHRTVAAEIATAVSVLTPIVTRTRDQHSASARDTFGTIALSDPIDGLGMAATLAHELQHAKLNALSEVVELIGRDDGRRYYAPWRPDSRPLFGLLHGAYAHAGLAGFWRRHTEDTALGLHAQVEFTRWREAAHQVAGTLLDSGGLTEAGTRFVTTLRDTLGRWQAEPVTPAAAAQARLQAERHRQEWSRANTP
jgi:HEXXH motif-containing protein